jgi:homoserine/homoserine lactone efflux protein
MTRAAARLNTRFMHVSTLVAFIALELVLCFIPGPAVMAVVGAALGHVRAGFATTAGILTGNLIYFVISALGLASIILTSHTAFVILKWCGAAYLAYLGIRALLASAAQAPRALTVLDQHRLVRGWIGGTVTQLANPKALVFFMAILPQFIDPHARVMPQIVILGVAGLAVELAVLSIYVAAVEHIRTRGLTSRSQIWAERIGGVFLLGVAAAVVRE